MRLGSMCTGYGGLDLAVEAHFGAELAWYSELDKNCSRVLEHHWPGVPNHGDLTKADWSSVEPVDIMCAGFPCQPFSHAGKREGAEDERAIWPIIANAIGVLRPSIIVLENVAGLLTLGAVGVVGDLAGLGYNCKWGVIRASEAGAAHQRKRWFCIGYAKGSDGGQQKQQALHKTTRQAAELGEPDSPTIANAGGERHGGRQDSRSVGRMGERSESSRRQTSTTRQEPEHRSTAATTNATVVGLESLWAGGGLEEESGEPRRLSRFGAYEPAVARWEQAIGRLAPEPTDKTGVASEFVEWMMGLPEGWVTDVIGSRTAQLKMLGNGVVPQQAALALKTLA